MTQENSWHRLRESGLFWMAMAGLCFGVMGVFVKLGSSMFSTAELVFYRCLAGLVGILLIVLPQGRSLLVAPAVLKLHLTRSISGFVSLMLYFNAIAHLPLPTAVTLNYTSPIFLMLLTLLWQRQWPQRAQMLAVLLGFAGVVLLLHPTFSADQTSAGLIGLASGLLASIAYMNVHELGRAGEPEWRTVFYFSLVSSLGGGVLMLLQSEPLAAIRWSNVWIILGMGISATCAQLAMTRAYRKGRSLAVASFAYLTVVFSTLFGVLVWGNVLPAMSYLGIAVIIATGILTTLAQRRN
ncbi:Riboflavin transporter [Andreprevotia sp. IGB-42]|uniref:DMT family transporter n=1 Tax=Andreprevotia sp. IGB-42 TaxID=2497473 RepID=UPI00157F7716|nr:DMT family transporter [Andreprevotia sp. IGB-42]KAF0814179.1 Riboflavin transporter [Andreprevotia sp. IGB-42]